MERVCVPHPARSSSEAMRQGSGKAWLWGGLALVAIAAAVAAFQLLPELKAGEVDPLGALIGVVSLVVALGSLYLAYRALHPPPTVTEAAACLARAVKKTETAARRMWRCWPARAGGTRCGCHGGWAGSCTGPTKPGCYA